MADWTKISTPVVAPSVQGRRGTAAPAQTPPKGYAGADDVGRRAGVLNEEESPKNKASMKRLSHAIHSDQPLRGDVPRGFYLNILV